VSAERHPAAGPRAWEASPSAARNRPDAIHGSEAPAPAPNTAVAEADLAGNFHYATMARNRPRTLGAWRVTTASTRTADRVASLLGGQVHHDLPGGRVEILTTAANVDILLPGRYALLVHWQQPARDLCDGATQGNGRPCACPPVIAHRRAHAKHGRACQPHAELRFQLTSNPRLGTFGFACEDWSFIEQVTALQAALKGQEPSEPTRVRLELWRTLHPLDNGSILAYTRPTITLPGRRTTSMACTMGPTTAVGRRGWSARPPR
jgi:hypothetical protein